MYNCIHLKGIVITFENKCQSNYQLINQKLFASLTASGAILYDKKLVFLNFPPCYSMIQALTFPEIVAHQGRKLR